MKIEVPHPKTKPAIRVGLAISDASFASPGALTLPEDLDCFFRLAADRLPGRGLFFEFQPELPWIIKESGSRFVPDAGNRWLELSRTVMRNDLSGPYGPVVAAMNLQKTRNIRDRLFLYLGGVQYFRQ